LEEGDEEENAAKKVDVEALKKEKLTLVEK